MNSFSYQILKYFLNNEISLKKFAKKVSIPTASWNIEVKKLPLNDTKLKVLSKNFLDSRLLIFNELIKKQFHKKREGYMQRLKNHMASPIAAEITDLVDFKD